VAEPPKKKKVKMAVVEVEPAEVAAPAKKAPKAKEAAPAKGSKKAKAADGAVGSSALASSSADVQSVTAALLTAKCGSAKTQLDRAQVHKAVVALLTHVERTRANNLLDDDALPIHVLVGTKAVPKAVGKATQDKAVPLPLPYPFVSLDTAEICLITKDPQRTYKDKLAAAGLRAKVIGVSKLKKKYHPYEAKRELCASYDVFLADHSVLPMLPPLLGKVFYEKKKLPTPVDLKKADIRAEMARAACGTLFRHASGTSNSLQVGTSEQAPERIVENVVAAVEQVVANHTKGKWAEIQTLQLRTTNSIALPFFSSLPHA
jgi:ribosome biogenesis protein UTP30